MKKRMLSTLLALCMVLAFFPVSTVAHANNIGSPQNEDIMPLDDYLTYNHFQYSVDNGEVTIRGCVGSDIYKLDVLSIPSEIDGMPVTRIGERAFYYTTWFNAKTVTIPNGVTSIGAYAFGGCYSLINVYIPDSVERIESSAFGSCHSLTRVNIPDGITAIEEGVFANCKSLAQVSIPNSVTRIEYGAFLGCDSLKQITIPDSVISIATAAFFCAGLTSITIPANVESIGTQAFACKELSEITVSPMNASYASYHGMLINKDTSAVVCFPSTKSSPYNIPNNISTIGECAFSFATNIPYIVIPISVVAIEEYGTDGLTGLTDIYYAGSEEDWKQIRVARNNYPLSSATIHYNSTGPDDPGDTGTQTANGVLRSGDGWKILWECKWKEVNGTPTDGRVDITMEGSANRTDDLYIYNENSDQGFPWELAPYNIPKTAIKTLSIGGELVGKRLRIAANSFQGYRNLETVLLDDVTGIDTYAFEGCTALKSVDFISAVELTTIGKGAFKNCTSLSEMEVPGNLEHIGDEAFQNTALGTITLGRSVAEIGANAFTGCRNLKIRCYEGSAAHRYAQDNNIPFELISDTEGYVNISYGNGKKESFEHNLDYYISQTTSTTYSPALSHMLIALSNAAYDENNIKASMKALGFTDSNILSHYVPGDYGDLIAYAMAKKTLPDGNNLVLVTVRGSSSGLDWLSNFAIGNAVAGCYWHAGFESAVNEVYSDLAKFVGSYSNTTFVITGHSRGAAVANLLAVKLFDAKVPKKDVYGYNFACPDVAAGLPTGWNWMGEHNNIFNIGNAPDPFSVVPGAIGSVFLSAIPGTTWGKFGQSFWFSKDWSSLYETSLDLSFSAHGQEVYLEYLRNEPAISSFKTWGERVGTIASSDIQTLGNLFAVFCPVDVTITDDKGNLVVSVIDGVENYYNSSFGEVMIFSDGDRKAIFVKGNSPLTVHFTATDNGVMEYTVQSIDLDTSEIISNKSFTSVDLVNGKQMLSVANVKEITGTDFDVSRVPLYVLGNDGEPEKEVLPDGNGTEVPITKPTTTYTVTFDGYQTMTTGTDGKLSNLPTPTRNGYTFVGWYMADGTRVTINTVFTGDTTVYARWSEIGKPSTPSGSSSSSSGSDHTPSYGINVPSRITGGTVKVSPTSASENQRITITAKANYGYTLESLTVTDSKGKEIELTDKGDNKYTFRMPDSKVTVDAKFELTIVTPPQSKTAIPTSDKLEVDGKAQTPAAYKLDDYNYFRLRDLATLLNGTDKQFSVDFNPDNGVVTLTTGQPYTVTGAESVGPVQSGVQSALPSDNAIYVDGTKIQFTAYQIGGYNYFKLRDLGKSLNFYVGWTPERGMFIESSTPYSEWPGYTCK